MHKKLNIYKNSHFNILHYYFQKLIKPIFQKGSTDLLQSCRVRLFIRYTEKFEPKLKHMKPFKDIQIERNFV